jgi:hypothetical protein
MPHGSMPVSRSSGNGAEGYSSSSTKTYVDNSYNRSLGRVGMEHGSMVVSKGSNTVAQTLMNSAHWRVGTF